MCIFCQQNCFFGDIVVESTCRIYKLSGLRYALLQAKIDMHQVRHKVRANLDRKKRAAVEVRFNSLSQHDMPAHYFRVFTIFRSIKYTNLQPSLIHCKWYMFDLEHCIAYESSEKRQKWYGNQYCQLSFYSWFATFNYLARHNVMVFDISKFLWRKRYVVVVSRNSVVVRSTFQMAEVSDKVRTFVPQLQGRAVEASAGATRRKRSTATKVLILCYDTNW